MSELEKENKKEIRRTKINSAIMDIVAGAGIVAVALVAPKIFENLAKTKYFRQRKYQLNSSFSRLVSAGYIFLEEKNGKKYARLTSKGEKYVSMVKDGKIALKKPKHWDKKWRILIFDIPEKKKGLRNKVRDTLISIGFTRLQDSVWVYPYDCEGLVTMLKADLQIGKDLLYIIADKIEYDIDIRNKFGLAD